jgi:TPR repeat protein
MKKYTKAKNKGNITAITKLATCYENSFWVEQKLEKAIMFYGKAIESGDLNALIKLSNYYFIVHNISENLKLTKRLFKRIIKNPHLYTILRISGCHESANSPSPFSISPSILF